MSRLKKRSGAGAGAVSTGMVATRGDGMGGDAPPSAARAITGDAMVRRTKNRNACHICLLPLSFVLCPTRGSSTAAIWPKAAAYSGRYGARAVPARAIWLLALIIRAAQSVSDHLARRNYMTAVLFFLAVTRLTIGHRRWTSIEWEAV